MWAILPFPRRPMRHCVCGVLRTPLAVEGKAAGTAGGCASAWGDARWERERQNNSGTPRMRC